MQQIGVFCCLLLCKRCGLPPCVPQSLSLAAFRDFLLAGVPVFIAALLESAQGSTRRGILKRIFRCPRCALQEGLGACAWCACVLAGDSLLALRWAGPCARADAGDLG